MKIKAKLGGLKKGLKSYQQNLAKNPKKRWSLIGIFAAIIIAILVYANLGTFFPALVNGKPITRWQLISELEKQGGKQVLDSMVTQSLIFQEAKKNNIAVNQEDIDAEIAKIETQLKAQGTDLDTALAFQGQTRADLTDNLKIKIIVEKLLADQISVSEEEIQEYFKTNQASFDKNTPLTQVKDSILATLQQQKLAEQYQKLLSELQAKANIKYLLNF